MMASSSVVKSLLLVWSLVATVSAAIVPIEFSALEASSSQKIVLFHDPTVEKSMQKLQVLEALDAGGVYSEYEYTVCDVTTPDNAEAVKVTGFTEYPMVFVQTTDSGIEQYVEDFTVETFATYHEFRVMHITSDRVRRVTDSENTGDVRGSVGMLELAADRPVFVKMYEVRHPHPHHHYGSRSDKPSIQTLTPIPPHYSNGVDTARR
jgi:hypothetical protein